MNALIKRFIIQSILVVALSAAVAAQQPQGPNVPFPEGDLTNEKLGAFLDELIDSLVARDEFSGTILIAREGKPIYTRAAGEACKWYNIPNKLDTKFCLGSMNKMFTSVAIAQLAEQGKLTYDDKVGQHLPDYPNQDVKDKVTIHQLLTHTAGMGMYWKEMFASAEWPCLESVQEIADLTSQRSPLYEPGERFEYSNCGPIVLGLIIEKISGLTYDDYIRKYVTGPAGMINTDCYDIKNAVTNVAIGYTKWNFRDEQLDDWIVNLYTNPTKGGPAGGGYSTVEDLLRFDIALRDNKLLSQKYFDIITTGKIDRDETRRYAYLFEDKRIGNERILGHGGGAPGVNAILAMYMNSGYTVAIMSNYDGGIRLLSKKMEELLTSQ